jgi:hypothetical protein
VGVEDGVESDGGCEVEEVDGVGPGPVTLGTRKRDLPINGPPFSCPSFFAALETNDDDVDLSDPIESPEERSAPANELTTRRQKSTSHRSVGEIKKTNAKMNLNTLPFNMLRKLPGGLKEVKKRKSKKHKKKRKGDRNSEIADSDSSDDVQCCVEGTIQSLPNNFAAEGLELEVVLPFHTEERISQVTGGGTSGVELLVEGGGFIVDDYNSAKSHECDDGLPVSREMVEAKKLIALNMELGVNFHDGEGEDVGRMMGLEVRDKAEKNGWEQSRGYQ